MKKLIGLITVLAGLPGLAGIYLLWKLGNLPPGAVFIVVNAIVFRGICGTAGGVLLWSGKRLGNYLTALSWSYLIIVSLLTLVSLYNKGAVHSAGAAGENFAATLGKPVAWSLVKLLLGLPIVYLVIKDIFQSGRRKSEDGSICPFS